MRKEFKYISDSQKHFLFVSIKRNFFKVTSSVFIHLSRKDEKYLFIVLELIGWT